MPLLAPVPSPSAPPPLPQAKAPAPIHLRHTWTGWDGSLWDLSDVHSGVRLNAGVRGLTMPPVQSYEAESPALAGARDRGFRVPTRPVFWAARVYQSDKAEWYAYDAAFWRTMHPAKTGTWSVVNPITGTTRTLTLRFVDDSDYAMDMDPGLLGWTLYGINLKAQAPYWTGAPIVRSFVADQGTPFFGGEGEPGGPPFYLSRGNTLASAQIDNPGDVDAYPVYVLDGPWDAGVSVGVGSNVTIYDAAIAAGKSVVMDTRPGYSGLFQIDTPTGDDWLEVAELATRTGTNMRANADPANYKAVPVAAGDEQPLTIAGTGTGSVRVALRPLYFRAW